MREKPSVRCFCQSQTRFESKSTDGRGTPDLSRPCIAACGGLNETKMTETWSAENSKNRVSQLRARCTLFTVIVREGVLTAWYGQYRALLSPAECHQHELHAESDVARLERLNGSQYRMTPRLSHQPKASCGCPRMVQ